MASSQFDLSCRQEETSALQLFGYLAPITRPRTRQEGAVLRQRVPDPAVPVVSGGVERGGWLNGV
jgi:hypothetical protein